MRDDELRDLVVDELAWDALIDDSQIDVQVVGGIVTLVGTVPSDAEKLAAQDAARAVAGVHDLLTQGAQNSSWAFRSSMNSHRSTTLPSSSR